MIMERLRLLLNAFLEGSLTIEEFSNQFIQFWNEIRIDQNKAIEQSGKRDTLDELWTQYRSGNLDGVTYGMKWTETLSDLQGLQIAPTSIVNTIGDEVYHLVMLQKEAQQFETEKAPPVETIREQVRQLLDTINA